MHYLHRTAERRADVRAVMPSARIGHLPRHRLQRGPPVFDRERGSRPGSDRAIRLGRRLPRRSSSDDWTRCSSGCGTLPASDVEARAYVDTGPVQERVYAQYAGLGWIGKNTCVINPSWARGSSSPRSSAACRSQPDAPALDQCGTCTLCLEACPTGALVEPGVLDSTRCLSYLTIELKGPIPAEQRERRVSTPTAATSARKCARGT